jgi:hypothetical protein
MGSPVTTVVGEKAKDWITKKQWFNSSQEQEIFFISTESRPAPRPSQPFFKSTRHYYPGAKAAVASS